ncbi:MAG: hypothetical protein AAGA56_25045 [Myxococcota bacterium]
MAGRVEQDIQEFANDGLSVGVVTVMFPSGGSSPLDWVQEFNLENVYVSEPAQATPGSFTVPPSNGNNIGTPYVTVVDTVTMSVVYQGNPGANWPSIVRETAEANAN